jgi:predicted O-methyltransferase YrrM
MLFGLPKGGVVAEVGTEYGLYTGKILEVCTPAAMHLIDHDFSVFAKERFAGPIADGVLHFHEGDSSTLLAGFPDATFDWIYIDADHRYDGVSRDIRAAVPKVKPGGLLAFNDYTFWSPYEQSAYGVPAAIHELCIEDHWEFVFFAFEPRGYHDVALRRLPR